MVTQAVLLQRITRAPSMTATHTMEARPAVATAQASVDARALLSLFPHKKSRGRSRMR
jgi:hypothetical protein